MAKTLTLRNVPTKAVSALRARARRNGRSMQRELLAIVEGAVLPQKPLAEQIRIVRSGLRRPLGIQEIQQAIDEGRP